jgi:hypothetical protein
LGIGYLLYRVGHEMNTTPPCPADLFEFQCTLCDVDLVCHFEYIPAERGSVDAMGAPYEANIDESVELISVYVNGSDVDILQIIAATYWDDLERLALADLKAYK